MKITWLKWLLACFSGSTLLMHAGERPNIVFFFADDQAYDTIGCYGNPDVKTPNMDRIGRSGLIFDRHYNTTAICMASRANVMTGLLEYRTGCNFMHGPMARSIWNESYPLDCGAPDTAPPLAASLDSVWWMIRAREEGRILTTTCRSMILISGWAASGRPVTTLPKTNTSHPMPTGIPTVPEPTALREWISSVNPSKPINLST
jgi:hypothetical protein